MAEMKSTNAHARGNRNDTPRKRKTHIIKVRVTAEEKLRIAYQTLSSEKNGFYTRYKKAQIELRELRTAQQNVEAFFRKEERSHAVPQQEVK